MAYTDINAVQEYLRTTYTVNSVPSLSQVSSIINRTDKILDEITCTTFGGVLENTQVFHLNNTSVQLFPKKLPLRSVISVMKNSVLNGFASPVFDIPVKNVQDGNLVYLNTAVSGLNAVEMVYTYGYATVPQTVSNLAKLLVVKEILGSEENSTGAFSEVRIGPITAKSGAGGSRKINLDADIAEATRRVSKFKLVVE